jgi:hypothetical protein
MEFIKLNEGWDADPNDPVPKVEIDRQLSKIILSFGVNYFIHDNVTEDDVGILEFFDCYKYRLGSTNDHGFYLGQCRFSNTGIVWGDFYNMKESNWEQDFPKDEIIVDVNLKKSLNNKHYLFYFRDQTFECIASSYKYKTIRQE